MSDQQQPAAAPSDAEVEAIYSVIRDFNLTNMVDADDGGDFPLVDAMTCDGCSIADGEEQMRALSYDIASALRQQHAAATAAAVQAVVQEAARICEVLADCYSKDGDGLEAMAVLNAQEGILTLSKADGTTTLAALLAEARKDEREKCARQVEQMLLMGRHVAAKELRDGLPTPSPERGEAQQQGAGGNTDGE